MRTFGRGTKIAGPSSAWGGGVRFGRSRPRISLSLAAIIIIGTALALYAAGREYRQVLGFEALRLDRAIHDHATALQAHLSAREDIALATAAALDPPQVFADALGVIDDRLLSRMPAVVSLVWAPRTPADRMGAALAALSAEGVRSPEIMLPEPTIDPDEPEVVYPVLAIRPPTEQNRQSLGLDLYSLPRPRQAMVRALETMQPTATAPVELIQLPGVRALVLYVPIYHGSWAHGTPLGFIGFSFRFDRLLDVPIDSSLAEMFSFRVIDTETGEILLSAGAPPGHAADMTDPITRTIHFGQRIWSVPYVPVRPPEAIAMQRALAVLFTGFAGVGAMVLLSWYIALTNRRLAGAVEAHEASEARLQTLLAELNHRVKNMLALVQVVVRRSLAAGRDLDSVEEVLVGRLEAMARATTLLSETNWRGASLHALVAGATVSASGRIAWRGPDIALGAPAAQALTLLLHELVTNATRHGALSAPGGRVDLEWQLCDGRFRLVWSERGGPRVVAPARSGFGQTLIERAAPAQVGGTGALDYRPEGIVYTLEAPERGITSAVFRDDVVRPRELGGRSRDVNLPQ